jgi:hypothetical protein
VPSFPDLDQPLGDGVIALRETAERDIPEVLIAYQDDPGLHRALGERRPPSGAELGRRAEQAAATRAAGAGLVLTIVPAEGPDTWCGEVRVQGVDWAGGRARLVVGTAPQVRGRGIEARALKLTQEWLSRTCGITATAAI